mgnify:FL=1
MLAIPRKDSAKKAFEGNAGHLSIRMEGTDFVAFRQLGQIRKIYFEIVFFMLAKQD